MKLHELSRFMKVHEVGRNTSNNFQINEIRDLSLVNLS